jgi:hypothetical protein
MTGFSTSIPASNLNRFLYASICEDCNGVQLSVLSALARANVDPWEEAARLATMPKATAEEALAAILHHASALNYDQPEAEAVAARLITLLPQEGGWERPARTDSARGQVNHSIFWAVWLSFIIAASLLSPRQQGVDSGSAAVSRSSAVSPLQHDSPFSRRAAPSSLGTD